MARGSVEGGEVASGLGCDGRRHGEARRDAAVTAVAEGDGGARGEAADLAGGGGYAGAGDGGSRERGARGGAI